jgi:hypothetical protein
MKEKIIDLVMSLGEWDGVVYLYYIDPIRISPTEEILSIDVVESDGDEDEYELLARVMDENDNTRWLWLFGELDKYHKDAFDKVMDGFNGILDNIGNITKIK